ncbi:MAG: GNAT family N-acetyltransferase [Clostridiales bacterium]|jgi:predicted enzyme related to lactoylglutathione lyase/GNAT superfamily N-acetyltransferase|nr:GNAT family N-acetyltransferase [Clostridiales bacterium]
MKFSNIGLVTNDVLTLRAFYKNVFGGTANGDELHSTLESGNISFSFSNAANLKKIPSFNYVSNEDKIMICFNVTDANAEYKRLLSLGTNMLNEPVTQPWGACSFQFKDTDGNIIYFRSVPPNEIALYEEISMNAHPAIRTQTYDGWILRFCNGFTNRANSVNMLAPSTIVLEEKIKFCEDIYSSQNLASVFKITPLSENIDALLESKGYEIITPTNLMTMTLKTQNIKSEVVISDKITSEWHEDFFRLSEITDVMKKETDKIIHSNIINKKLYASISENGKCIAAGMCVVEREYVGLYDIVTDKNFRGKGLGFDICAALLNNSMQLGAKHAYIQVVAENTPAVALYKKLGFENCYQYWYRVKGNYRVM